MSISKLNLSGFNSFPLVRQNEAAECGLACIAMVAGYYGHITDIASLRRKYKSNLLGMTLRQLIDVASRLKLSSRPLSVPLEVIDKLQLPAIIHWDMNHFVVLHAVKGGRFLVHDPAIGERSFSREEFSRHFTGIALELSPSAEFQKKKDESRLRLGDLWQRIHGLKHNLLQVLLLSIVLQLFVLASPFYLQLAIDEVLSSYDRQLLLALALGFSGFTIIQFVTQALRAHVVLYFGSMLGYQIAGNLFRHMLGLPLGYFEKRHIGDVLSRFASVEPLRAMLSEGFISGLIDGLMTLTTLVMMLVYSPLLASIALAAWLVYLLLRVVFYRPYYQAQQEAIQKRAIENSTLIETLKGISSIKLLAAERERLSLWQNRYADVVNTNARFAKYDIWFNAANQLISGLEYILLVFVAVKMSMAGGFTVGMIFAFMAYKRNFTENATGLVEKLIEYRMLRLHLDRLADIALSEKEESDREDVDTPMQQDTSLNLSKVSFDYGESENKLIDAVELEVQAGECLAISGASGCGKTTLLKLMTGLLKPDSGEIRFGGRPLSEYGMSRFRQHIGVVMQEDGLFTGSIAENIAFFAEAIDMDRVIESAKFATIHDEILQMPMAYESLVGDMGSALSAGQKQRVILARALYRQPSLLFMDEGSAHLDGATERRMNDAIAKLGITRILIAHRAQTISSADRVLQLKGGKLEATGKC